MEEQQLSQSTSQSWEAGKIRSLHVDYCDDFKKVKGFSKKIYAILWGHQFQWGSLEM